MEPIIGRYGAGLAAAAAALAEALAFAPTATAQTLREPKVTVSLGDGTVETFTAASMANSYRGFTSDFAINSLVISGPGASRYAAIDNLTVGTVPEPTSWALVGLALSGLIVARRRSI